MQQEKVILLQVDGLSRKEFERACEDDECPNLKKHRLSGTTECRTFYSGLPSSTPGVQAEIFYGVKSAVPAFSFRDAKHDKTRMMYNPSDGSYIEENLQKLSKGLLTQGSSYSNVYTGGASEYHAVPAGWIDLRQHLRRLRDLGVMSLLGWLWMCLHIIVSLPFEFIYALGRAIEGSIKGYGAIDEFKMIPTRILLAVTIREVITEGIRQDQARGFPIIHANFLAYDEASHRRGPDSAFAHSMIKLIDCAVGKIIAHNESCDEPYKLVIYSDHGQEAVEPFPSLVGSSLEKAIANLNDLPTSPYEVCDKGPLGLIYFKENQSLKKLEDYASVLAKSLPTGGALFLGESKKLMIATHNSVRLFEADDPLLENHPEELREQIVTDLHRLASEGFAADITLLGWRIGQKPLSFAQEYGAHGGIGVDETEGFILTEDPKLLQNKWVRPCQLYERFTQSRNL